VFFLKVCSVLISSGYKVLLSMDGFPVVHFVLRNERRKDVPLLGHVFASPFGRVGGLFEEQTLVFLAPIGKRSLREAARFWTRSFDFLAGIIEKSDPLLLLRAPCKAYGTPFQHHVWRALQKVPFGYQESYSQLATRAGFAQAPRAVAKAVATNPLALIIPCHRIVMKKGAIGGYRWGIDQKNHLLAWEKRMLSYRHSSI
jgi:O-6-methylguanine DNA methyltransferase